MLNHMPPRKTKPHAAPNAAVRTVDDYIAAQPKPVQSVLRKVRAAIRKAMPDAEEIISYKIPAYKLNGRVALYFAGWTEHYSLYPAKTGFVNALRFELAPYEIRKGTIRFPISEPVPAKLIERIARFRAKELEEPKKANPKPARSKRATSSP